MAFVNLPRRTFFSSKPNDPQDKPGAFRFLAANVTYHRASRWHSRVSREFLAASQGGFPQSLLAIHLLWLIS
jgi:hypothetical protein